MCKAIVVVNTTPIILLQKIGCLSLLRSLYGSIHIPEAVYEEAVIDGRDKMDALDSIALYDWIKIDAIQDVKAKRLFVTSLHKGEVETIILAIEIAANLCILDDLMARKYAQNMNINITGTLGVLIAAKNKGYVKEVKPLLDKLIAVGMYISDELYKNVLIVVNEWDGKADTRKEPTQ